VWGVSGLTKAWDGGELLPCKKCGVDDWESLEDRDHDGGSCEIFKCKNCGSTIHIELPD
jgi:hypothetical protein